jgi:hypothetical protein
MSNERIDLTQWKNENKETLKECVAFSHEYVIHERNVDVLIAELKRCYELEDVATEALLENAEMMRGYVGQIIEMKRKIRDMIDVCEGVDSLFGEEVIGMLQDLLA